MNEKQEKEVTSVYSVCRWFLTKLISVGFLFLLTEKL